MKDRHKLSEPELQVSGLLYIYNNVKELGVQTVELRKEKIFLALCSHIYMHTKERLFLKGKMHLCWIGSVPGLCWTMSQDDWKSFLCFGSLLARLFS